MVLFQKSFKLKCRIDVIEPVRPYTHSPENVQQWELFEIELLWFVKIWYLIYYLCLPIRI